VAAQTNAERQRRWRAAHHKNEPQFDRAEQLRQARERLAVKRYLRPVTKQSPSKTVEAPNAEFVAAFDRAFPRFSNYVKAHVYSGTRDDSQDLAAEVRLRFLEQGGRIRKAKNVKAWMYRVLNSLLADRGREADKRYELIGGIREEIKDEFAAAALRIGVGLDPPDENPDDEQIEREDPKVELTKRERTEADAETKDRQDNPYYRSDDDELESEQAKAVSELLRRSPKTDPLLLGSWHIRIGDPPGRPKRAVQPTGPFLVIQSASLRTKRTTTTWRNDEREPDPLLRPGSAVWHRSPGPGIPLADAHKKTTGGQST
jgi:DNA-directed RNA polymerase specialized sigma24 family protein